MSHRLLVPLGASFGNKDDSWVISDIHIRIKDGSHAGKVGMLRSVGPNKMCTIEILGESGPVQIPGANLEPVRPDKRERIKLLSNSKDSTGSVGALVAIDGNDAIVKLDSNPTHFKIVSVDTVGKLVE